MPDVTIYTTAVCPYCLAAKQLLRSRQIDYKEIQLDFNPSERQRLSAENGGWKTVPMVFIDQTFIGGFTELRKLSDRGGLSDG